MHIRKTAGQKTEISLDEPINTDWDGNELLLSDILGTEEDVVMRPMEEDVERQLLREALSRLPERERYIISCASASADSRSARRRRSLTVWASRSRIFRGSRNGLCSGCDGYTASGVIME